jgi:hypothetical protein
LTFGMTAIPLTRAPLVDGLRGSSRSKGVEGAEVFKSHDLGPGQPVGEAPEHRAPNPWKIPEWKRKLRRASKRSTAKEHHMAELIDVDLVVAMMRRAFRIMASCRLMAVEPGVSVVHINGYRG